MALGVGLLVGLDFFSPDLMLSTMLDLFVPLDLLFYGLAILLGYLLKEVMTTSFFQ